MSEQASNAVSHGTNYVVVGRLTYLITINCLTETDHHEPGSPALPAFHEYCENTRCLVQTRLRVATQLLSVREQPCARNVSVNDV